jgi:peroxiredoxin (alkyl hydroperoxide reductase subunit C)
MNLTGKKFPSIDVKSINSLGEEKTINVLELAQKEQKKIVLFWYPKDFTFVCPTELHAFQEAVTEFEKRNTIVIGASVDTAEVHFAWLNTPKKQGGIEGVKYDIIADSNRNLSSVLDILDSSDAEFSDEYNQQFLAGDHVTYRATYLIDEQGEVFHQGINHMPLGRNVKDYLRMIDAYSHIQEHGEVCPANWQEGKQAMHADRGGVADYLSSH